MQSTTLHNPFKFLHTILENPTFSSIISWYQEGDSFNIFNFQDFINTILKNYYPNITEKLFVKQLKSIGFKKTVLGSVINFKNPEFQRSISSNQKKLSKFTLNPSRKKSSHNNDFSAKVKILESSQLRMEESMGELECKFERIIKLNKFLISELNSSLEREKAKFNELKQHFNDFDKISEKGNR